MSVGILNKEIRRVSDPDKAQIIWDGIKVGDFEDEKKLKNYFDYSDCESPEADPCSAPPLQVHEQELQAGQGHHPAPSRPRRRGQPCEAAQEGEQIVCGVMFSDS